MTPPRRHPSRPRRGFTLVELLVVALVLAILASLALPSLASATAPLPRPLADLLEADLRRARIEAVGAVRDIDFVVGKGRDRWWIQAQGPTDPSAALPNSMRVFGSGNLSPYAGHALDVRCNGAALPATDVVVAAFSRDGARDRATVDLALIMIDGKSEIARWRMAPERTRLKDVDVDARTQPAR